MPNGDEAKIPAEGGKQVTITITQKSESDTGSVTKSGGTVAAITSNSITIAGNDGKILTITIAE